MKKEDTISSVMLRYTTRIDSNPANNRAAAIAALGHEPQAELALDLTTEKLGLEEELLRTKALVRKIEGTQGDHSLAVFAFGTMPLLMALGYLLGDKRPVQVYQAYRDRDAAETWVWETSPLELNWDREWVQRASGAKHVAVLLSVSGRVSQELVEKAMEGRYAIHELRIASPSPLTPWTREHVSEFVIRWRALVEETRAGYGSDVTIHLFPALPLAMSVRLGCHALPRIDPAVRVYDLRGAGDQRHFVPELELSGGAVVVVGAEAVAGTTLGLTEDAVERLNDLGGDHVLAKDKAVMETRGQKATKTIGKAIIRKVLGKAGDEMIEIGRDGEHVKSKTLGDL